MKKNGFKREKFSKNNCLLPCFNREYDQETQNSDIISFFTFIISASFHFDISRAKTKKR